MIDLPCSLEHIPNPVAANNIKDIESHINSDLEGVKEWLIANKLSLNIKCRKN
jgi:hypothetical protein